MVRFLVTAFLALSAPLASQSQVPDWSKEPVRIPDKWIDLPESPFVAVMHNGKASLLNRSSRRFRDVGIGCVFVDSPTVRIEHQLMATHLSHGTFGPGGYNDELLHAVNIIDLYERAAGMKRCPDGTRPAVTSATEPDGTKWTAEGTASSVDLVAKPQALGVVIGTVRDTSGGVIPGVEVTATLKGKSTTATTGADGEFAIAGLEAGEHTISGLLAGFRMANCDRVEVGAAIARCELTLRFGGPPIPRTDARYQALEAAESRWRASRIQSYEYGVSVACFCGFDRTPFAVRVMDGAPEKQGGPDPRRNAAAEHYNTVEKLFAKVRAAFDRGDELVDVSYDAATGRPLVISLDMSRQAEDDDVLVIVSGFTIIK